MDAPISESQHSEHAPVLQLFNNNIVSRTEVTCSCPEDPDSSTRAEDLTPKANAVRTQLLKLVPCRSDMLKIRNAVTFWWAAWHYMFPEILDGYRSGLIGDDDFFDIPSSPGELAKFLICWLMSIEQLPQDFDYAGLQNPFNPQEYTEKVITDISRLVIYDEDLASTLPGLEAMVLMSKWYTNLGRPRKAWLLNRRAIELGQLSGLHISTRKDPRPDDVLYDRRLKLWAFIGLNDRFLGLLFGLPYAIHENSFRPQVERRLRTEKPTLETFVLRVSLIMAPMIDRNMDDPDNMSLAVTLKLEQELETQLRAMPERFWAQQPNIKYSTIEEQNDNLIAPFMYHFLRMILHLPFMLKSYGDRRYQYSQDTALESARCALHAYRELRSWEGMNPYICRVIDFQAFNAAMLLVINLVGYAEDAPNHSQEQDEKDWSLVETTIQVLRKAAAHPTGTVAAQSVNILQGISQSIANMEDVDTQMKCKVTVPYFGVITVSPGKKKMKSRNRFNPNQLTPSNSSGYYSQTSHSAPSSEQASPFQIYTPPQSTSSDQPSSTANNWASSSILVDDPRVQLENMVAFPNTGIMDQNVFTGFTMGNDNLGAWSNLNLDLDLDQGWNLNWSDTGVL
jgi:hypothetical protein